ncbi:hypothetical protein FOT62_27660 [Serratia marcescens]|uniref:Uncharacterized protein n=1 Tax=Serratia marcescens TaxID=615 RepID=A0A5C7BDM1_SERMA|nr:hypothetical protein [Serratia marcescens]TXE21697.1 hypothetical protein FOT62_27660 [Serratia marcescens]TXE57172.1 hypothetical protein FOT56_23460 [Serratia marcescens]
MPVYHLSTRIKSNVAACNILYDFLVYRVDSKRNKIIIIDVKQQPLQSNYETRDHMTQNITDDLSTIFIMEVTIYRKTMLKTLCMTPTPFTRMYTLGELASGNAWSPVKRENPCYFETQGTPRPENQGGHTQQVQITIPSRPFIAKEYPIGDVRDPFEKNKIETQINRRYNWQDYPNQGGASTCGPAAFFYCLQKDRPDVYAQAARDLWKYGKTKIGHLEIVPGDGCKHPSGDFYDNYGAIILGVDWMTLVGLRDSENAVLNFDTLDSPVAGITLWDTLSSWFERAGYEKTFSNVGITQAGVQGIRELNEYVKKGYRVITLINDGLLEGSQSERMTVPTHWIVWNGPVIQCSDNEIYLDFFSWGRVNGRIKEGKSLDFFINRFFGGMVFKPLK